METGGEFPGCPGVAEDRIAVGSGGVVGDFNVESRITLMVNKVGDIDNGRMMRDDKSECSPVGPAVVVFCPELKRVTSYRSR